MAPGAPEPSKLLLQYSGKLPLGVTSFSLLPCLEVYRIAREGASASSSPRLRRHRWRHCRERREGGGRGWRHPGGRLRTAEPWWRWRRIALGGASASASPRLRRHRLRH